MMASNLINLDSPEGQQLLDDVKVKSQGYIQPYLGHVFSKQKGGHSCGIQSCALVLSAASLGKAQPLKSSSDKIIGMDKNSLPYTEDKLLQSPLIQDQLKETLYSTGAGLSLPELHKILLVCGHDAEMYHAIDVTLDEFRSTAVDVLSELNSAKGIIVNYHMETLGQKVQFGHHSPLGAYHQQTDRFLIYDCWQMTKECWPTAQALFKAMCTIDKDTKKTRGYIVIKNIGNI